MESREIIDMIDGLFSELQVPDLDQAHIQRMNYTPSRHIAFMFKAIGSMSPSEFCDVYQTIA